MGFLTRLLAGLTAAAALGAGLTGTANAVDTTGVMADTTGTTKSVVKLSDDGGNETSEDTADNPDDDSTDADSTTDAGAQSDAGQQAGIQSSTSQDKATAKSSLPDHIVNGSFDYPACPDGKNSCDVDPTTGWGGFYVDYGRKFMPIPDWDRSKFGWDSSQEGLRPDQQPNSHQKLQHCVQIGNKPNNNGQKMNRFAEIIAETPDEYIYQDIATTPGVMYRWSLKHASEDASHVDSMQVMIGSPGRETAQDATRTTSNGRGDRTGVTSKTIATKGGQAEWETYTGVYVATSTVTRFTFKSAQGRDSTRGNFIDDVMFTKAYKLTYNKNSTDASGQVPSNQRGKENTTQPAKTKTNGKIRLASDTSKLSDHLVNSDFEYLPDGGWKTISARYDMASAYTSVDPNNGQYIRNTRHADSDTGTAWVDWDGFDSSRFAWRTDQKGGQMQGGLKDHANAVELQQDSVDGNTYTEIVASETDRTIYQDLATIPGTLYKIRLKHASLCKDNVDKMQVVINGTPIEMTRVTANGKAGDKVGEKSTTIATKVTNVDRWHHADQWETYEGYYVIPEGQTTTRFGFKAVNYLDPTKGNLLDDVTFARAYKLTYDKNASDATGRVPSNQRGKENTTQPVKAKTTGSVKTVADESVRYGSLFNGDFSYPSFSDIQKNEQENVADLRTFLKSDDGTLWYNMSSTDLSKYGKIGQIPGFDSSRFAWSSTENGSRVELQQDRNTKNTYAEIVAQQDNTSIYQNVSTGNGGVLYKIRLKHASRQSSHADRMQVLVGADTNHATPVEMTRVTSNGHGDKVGGKSTTIGTKVSNTDPRDHGAQWETYEGYYQVPEGQKNTVFMFKSLEGFKEVETLPGNNVGNLVDDIEFSRSYKLTYDANSSDASGQVPSDTTANTVKQAKAKTSGTVKTVADDDSSKSLTVNPGFDVPDYSKLDDGGLHWMYVNPSEGNAWSYYDYINPSAPKHQVSGLSQATFGWQELTGGDHKTTSFELHREKDGNVCADVHGSRTIGQTIDTQAGVAYTVSIRHSGRSKGNAGSVQVLVGPDKDHLQPLEMSRMNVSRTGAKYGDKTGKVGTVITTHSDSVDSTEGDHPAWDHSDDWETYSGTYVATGGKTVFAYRGVDENGDSVSGNDPVADSVIDDLSFKLAYRLSYDKNAADAAGSIPSDEYGKENTVRQAKSKANGSVKLVADDDVVEYAANGLPKQIVNSDFDHDWRNIVGQSKMTGKYNFANVDPAHGDVEISGGLNGKGEASKQWMHLNGFDANKFGWKSNQTDTRVDGRGGIVEIQRSKANDNMYAEITASQANTYLYQDIDTAHDYPTVYTVKLRYAHRNGTINSNEKIQILVGAPGHEQPVEMTRIASDRGNRLGEKSTTVNAPNTDGWLGSWDTFQGSVVVPAGQDVSRFTFKALGSIDGISGNLIDDVQFKLAYKLSYDKNANDASGSVPSDETANTVKQAKAKTTGTVRAVADKTSDGLTVHDLKNGEIAPVQYGDFKFSTVNGFSADQVTNVNGFTVKTNWDPTVENQAYAGKTLSTMYQPNRNGASLVLHHVGQWRDSSGTQRWLNARITVNGQNLGSLVYLESKHEFRASYGKWDLHPSSRPYMDVTVNFLLDDGSTPQGLRGATGFTDIDGGTSGYNEGVELVSGFDGAYVRSDAHLARFGTNGWAGITDENKNNADAHGMKHYVGATFTGSSFRVRWSVASGQARQSGFQPVDSTIAYRLTYNKNAQDATGSIPSDTAANTTRPAKSETDGKVSDLVQRTTTHEDGSVTVKTIDQSTDVVSGCQVYYPAGQKITLATMAKDDDCWDASMLSRPGHTQLGWNQDRNATAAQPEVTMVEGGMTVYAVWVGNPVLTYDTNKPSTWSGQMPSTPASVSVPYNTNVSDESGWRAGDTTKIRGYRFLGWYTGPQDNAGLYDWTRPLTGSVTVYAHWQRLQANVIYDSNGGTGSHPNTTGWQYSDVTIPGDTSKSFKRTGYRFAGWNTAKDGKGTAYADGGRVPLQGKDVTLYAQWAPLFDVLPSAGGDYGPSVPWLVCGGLALVALVGGVASTLLRLRRARGAHSR